MADSQQRHFGKEMYFGYGPDRQPLLFWDASVRVRRTSDSNRGWDRRNHRDPAAARYSYFPDPSFESPIVASLGGIIKAGYFKWTRGGLQGVDFVGQEVDTSTW